MSRWDKTTPHVERICFNCGKPCLCAFISDPYMESVYNDPEEHWLCKECYECLLKAETVDERYLNDTD